MSICQNVNGGGTVIVEPTSNSAAYDAFGRLRVSEPFTLFDAKNVQYQNDLFNSNVTGNATVTYNANLSSVELTTTTTSGDIAFNQSVRRLPYQPGKSLLIFNTFSMAADDSSVDQKVGYFDENNGYFFEKTGSTLQFVRRSNTSGTVTDTPVLQSNWNVNTLPELDETKTNILFTDIEWLGVGSVRMGFVIDGQVITCHQFNNANDLSTVHIQSPNLPCRFEIENTGTASANNTLQQICSSVISEGGYAPTGQKKVLGSSGIGGINLVTAGTWYNMHTIRLKSGSKYQTVVPAGVNVLNVSNNDFEFALYKNATFTNAVTYTSYSDAIEYNSNVETISTFGTRVDGGFLGAKTAGSTLGVGTFAFADQLGVFANGSVETLTLAVRSASNNGNVAGVLSWFEL